MEVSVEEKVDRLVDFFQLPSAACADALERAKATFKSPLTQLMVVLRPDCIFRRQQESYGDEIASLITKISQRRQRVANGLNGQTTRVERREKNEEALLEIAKQQTGPLVFYTIRRVESVLSIKRQSTPTGSHIFGLWELLCESIANPRAMEDVKYLADGDVVLHHNEQCVPAVFRHNGTLFIEPIPERKAPRPEYATVLGLRRVLVN